MNKVTKIINWTMLVVGILAVIGLSSSDSTGDTGSGLIIGILWIIQSIVNLVLIDNFEKKI